MTSSSVAPTQTRASNSTGSPQASENTELARDAAIETSFSTSRSKSSLSRASRVAAVLGKRLSPLSKYRSALAFDPRGEMGAS